MSLYFLVDGYNLIHSRPDLFPGSIRASREKLIRLIRKMRPQGSSRNSITVFFDGQPGVSSPLEKRVDVVYTKGADADDYIEKRAARTSSPPVAVAVTDDKGLRKKVLKQGGRYMSLEEFILKLFPSPGQRRREGSKKKISFEEKEKINNELIKKWGNK